MKKYVQNTTAQAKRDEEQRRLNEEALDALEANLVAMENLPDVQDLTDIDQWPELAEEGDGEPNLTHVMPVFDDSLFREERLPQEKETPDRRNGWNKR